jgi:hypothetical protein
MIGNRSKKTLSPPFDPAFNPVRTAVLKSDFLFFCHINRQNVSDQRKELADSKGDEGTI